MMCSLNWGRRMKDFLQRRFSTVAAINRRYATPRVKTTRMVKVALFMLRLYLLILVAILFYKFLTLVL